MLSVWDTWVLGIDGLHQQLQVGMCRPYDNGEGRTPTNYIDHNDLAAVPAT